MKILIAPTEESVVISRTTLAGAVAKGTAAVLVLTDPEAVTDGCFACVGIRGNETAEPVRIDVSATVTADLLNGHAKGEPVSVMRYDSRRFYGSMSEGGIYYPLATLPIRMDDPQGTRYESTGAWTWFKATYYDSVSGDETDAADSDAVEGDQSARYCSLDRIRARAGMARNNYLQDDRFEGARMAAESEIDSTLANLYLLPLASVPSLVTEICELLASGAVMTDEFGGGEDSDGRKAQATARAMLKDIRDGRLKLISGGSVMAGAPASLPSFYPNYESYDDEDDPTAPKMPRNKEY